MNGVKTPRSDLSLTPVAITGLTSKVTAIAAGTGYTCVIVQDGEVRCWGYNESGQLGIGTNTTRVRPVDVINADGKPLRL